MVERRHSARGSRVQIQGLTWFFWLIIATNLYFGLSLKNVSYNGEYYSFLFHLNIVNFSIVMNKGRKIFSPIRGEIFWTNVTSRLATGCLPQGRGFESQWKRKLFQSKTPNLGWFGIVLSCCQLRFLIPSPSTTISSEKGDAAYLQQWMTVKGCYTSTGATHYLGPGGWAVRYAFFPFYFENLRWSYLEDHTSLVRC